MARTKKTNWRIRQETARTTWTRFQLLLDQSWIKWQQAEQFPDPDFGPLADVPGRLTVRLGRMVENRENAVLIILWQSSEALSDFLESPRCAPVLQSMGLADASPFRHSLQWESGFSLGEETFSDELYGRLTLTILSLDRPRQEARRSIVDAFGGFFPKGCRDFLDRPPWYPDAITWLEDTAAGDHPQVTSICYYFYRWNGDRSSTEREEVAIREPGARETWEGAVAKASPPTVSWEQQRWDVAVAPYQMRH